MANEKNVTCEICGGAIPNGEQMGGHTALCAGVLSVELTDLRHLLNELAQAVLASPSVDAATLAIAHRAREKLTPESVQKSG